MEPAEDSGTRPYHPKLPTEHLPFAPKYRRPPHGFWTRASRFVLHFALFPVQLYLVCLVASLFALAFGPAGFHLLTGALSEASGDLTGIAHSGQILLLAPLAGLMAGYPVVTVPLLVIAGALLLRIDWRAWTDRQREREDRHTQKSAPKPGDSAPRLLGDYPYEETESGIKEGRSDPLGYLGLVDVITRLILNSAGNTPFAVSIEAQWGMGKTTAMRMIERRLDHLKFTSDKKDRICFTVFFNAWKYSGDNVQRGLLSAVFEAIPPRAFRWYFGRGSRGRLMRLALALAGRVLGVDEAAARVFEEANLALRYRNDFEDTLRRVMTHWREVEGREPLLVVFIDDLDRCTPEETARTLETMKLFFDIPGCVFVLGFDPQMVAEAVARGHGDREGATYLKKLIQLNYSLPRPEETAFHKFIDDAIDQTGLREFFSAEVFRSRVSYQDLILQGTGRNPREIRRFLNALVVNTEVLSAPPQSQLHADDDRVALSLLLLLQIRWPQVYRDIVDRTQNRQLPDLLAAMDRAMDKYAKPTAEPEGVDL